MYLNVNIINKRNISQMVKNLAYLNLGTKFESRRYQKLEFFQYFTIQNSKIIFYPCNMNDF